MRQPHSRGGVVIRGARGSAIPAWRRYGLHLMVLAFALLVGLLAFFGWPDEAGAQQEIDPATVSLIKFQANDNDTCWGLAERYTGSAFRCPELVNANESELTFAGDEDPGLLAGKFYNVPEAWNSRFLAVEYGQERSHYFEITLKSIDATSPTTVVVESTPTVVAADSDFAHWKTFATWGIVLAAFVFLIIGFIIRPIWRAVLERTWAFLMCLVDSVKRKRSQPATTHG